MIDYTYKYRRDFDEDTPKLLEYLFNGGNDKKHISEKCNQGLSLIKEKYDCSDFRIEIFTRILCGYKEIIGKENEEKIINTLVNFPFFDQSSHSMCTWTENHQLIINVNAYLLGNLYPNRMFENEFSGRELAIKAHHRLDDWCDFIYRFGFSEFGSCNYYPETLAALGNIIEFCDDETLKNKFKIVLDLMCFDIMSSTLPNLSYNKATARAYVDNKINYFNYLKPHILSLLNLEEIKINHEREACFFLMLKNKDKNNRPHYVMPKVFFDIFNDKEKLLKECNGLNGSEYEKNGLLSYDEKNMLYIMTSGTSGSYVALRNCLAYLDDQGMWNHSMFQNARPYKEFAKYFPHLFSFIRRHNKDRFSDISYAQGNTYTYLKGNYSVSSLTRYQISRASFQQVSHILNLDGLSIFTTAPCKSMDKTGSPDYWIGSKTNADCIQYKNILIAYYKCPRFTHLFFPLEKFDKVNIEHIDQGFIFGQYHNINVMIKTNNKLEWADSTNDRSIHQDDKTPNFNLTKYDLLNKAKSNHFYIFEVDDTLSFEKFIDNALKEDIVIKYRKIKYKGLDYNYAKDCYYKSKLIQTSYPRYESKFIDGNRYNYAKDKPLTFISKKHKLTIDFTNFSRIEK